MKQRDKLGRFAGNKYKKINGVWYRKRCLDCGEWIKSIKAKRCKECHLKTSTAVKMPSGYSYGAIHRWLIKNYGKATYCQNKRCDNKSKVYEWANISKEYQKDINDYLQLCKGCHVRLDVWKQEVIL